MAGTLTTGRLGPEETDMASRKHQREACHGPERRTPCRRERHANQNCQKKDWLRWE
ncbi:hypothetical protein CHS0354_039549, partial [Potamilus streckersoni]